MKKTVIIFTVIFVVMLGGFFYYQNSENKRHQFKVWFLNIGQGDSALIQFADSTTMLVDCGANRRVLAELGRVLPFYIRSIDYVIATHPDLDHYGGCVDVLKRYQVKHIVINGRSKNDSFWREWDRAIRQEGAEIITMSSPTIWKIGSSTLQFLSPDPTLALDLKADDSNNYSIVFKLTQPISHATARTFLLTGDMEMPLENALMKKYCATDSCASLQADILKVGHHGSLSSSGEQFIKIVNPKEAVISVGKNNYGHPVLRVIRHLERAGALIRRTDTEGVIAY